MVSSNAEKYTERDQSSDRKEYLSSDPEISQPIHPDTPPDGGLKAWLQVAGSFFLFFNSWGTVNTFGVFQTYYEEHLLSSSSPSAISWIGALQAFLLLIVGVVSGPLYDAGYFKLLITMGAFLVVLGIALTSLCTQYWQIVLCQGICTGVGAGFLYVPSIAILPQYFSTKRPLVTAIATSGSSLGGVIYPLIFEQLLRRIGFSWTTRVLALVSLCTCLFSILAMSSRQPAHQKRRLLVDLSAFTEPAYALFCAAMFFGYIGFFIPIFYIQPYALQTRTATPGLAIYLVAILNAASVPGRIVPGLLAQRAKLNPLTLLLVAATSSGILTLAWIGIRTSAGILAFAALYGFFSGGFVSLPAVVLANLTPDLGKVGTRMGMCSAICSLGSLGGAPVAGAILNAAAEGGGSGGYLGLQLFSGLVILVTGGLLLVTRRFAGQRA